MNQLEHLTEFEALLGNYHPSTAALRSLAQTELVLLVAPTSSGRNRLIQELLKTGDYHYIVSDTTRQPRTNDGIAEQNGVEYWFRDEAGVLQDIKDGKYLEAAVIHGQQVSGMSIRELEQATANTKIAITDAEIAGLDYTVRLKPDTVGIFIVPPSFEEWQRRLHHRGAMPPIEYKRRMISAVAEFEAALERPYYQFVINDDLLEAAAHINRIAKLGTSDAAEQAAGRQLTEQLLLESQSLLRSL